jgi:hypothetical protein
MIVPFDGIGSFAQLTGTADLRGRLSMAGEWTPFAELSPEGLANAVWSSLAAQNNAPGTMGSKLNTASSGGVDLDALAAAVWAYINRTLTANPGVTTADIVTALNATTIPVDVRKVNNLSVAGAGTELDPWGPA